MLASSSNSRSWRPALATLLLVVAGCTEPEIDRPGTFRPVGANDRNLRAMLVNPQDEYGGVGAATARGDSGARSVTRLLTDRRRPLLNVTTARVGSAGDAAPDAPLSGGVTGGSAP